MSKVTLANLAQLTEWNETLEDGKWFVDVVESVQKYLEKKLHRRLGDQKVNQLNPVNPNIVLSSHWMSQLFTLDLKTQTSHPSEEVHNLTPTHGMYIDR